jgi:hypothetical protein
VSSPPLPPTLAARPRDERRGIPIPFVHEYDDGSYDLGTLNPRRAVQCALSRVCAICAQSLGFPLAFLGDAAAAERRAYTYPPMHVPCAEAAVRLYPPPEPAQRGPAPGPRVMLTTGSFELERPTRRGEPVLFRPAPGEVRTLDTDGSGAGPA